MGQGEETKTKPDPVVEIQERGEIFFFYRPKVDKDEAHGPEDVQRLYLVLRPESGERHLEEKQDPHCGKEGSKKSRGETSKDVKSEGADSGGQGSQDVEIEKQTLLRLIVMGRKSLPDPSKKSRPYWGFVEMVTTKIEDLKAALKGGCNHISCSNSTGKILIQTNLKSVLFVLPVVEEYETATRGHRHTSEARPAGEGVYRILRHNPGKKMHTHLIYKLEYPSEKEEMEPQAALNIAREASFLLHIKNPNQNASSTQFRGLKSKRKASFPAHMQGLFGHLRYHPADPPDFLNYEGCEFLLISASDDIEEELGVDLKTEQQESPLECSDLIKTFGESATTRTSLKGIWV